MSLPKIDLPRYQHHLFGASKPISYRAFTIKEQKILLLAKQTQDENQQIEAIKQIIELCTFNTVNPDELAFFDVEDLFLRIRSKSVSEMCELNYRDKVTNKRYQITVNLDDVRVTVPEGHSKKIELTDNIGIMMKYPTLNMVNNKDAMTEDEVVKKCIDYIYDSENIYPASEISKEDLNEWIEALDTSSALKIRQFFDSMPSLRHEVVIKLDDDRSETIKFEGIESFFT